MNLAFDADDQELQLFLAETNEHLQSLDQDIVQLETQPEDQQLLQSIFRSAHTIKGGAGMIGHQRMIQLAHAMENVLDGLRSRTFHVTPATIDALLAALDGLRVLTHEVVTRVPSEMAFDGVTAALEACLSAAVAPEQSSTASQASSEAPESSPGGQEAHDLAEVRGVAAEWAADPELAARLKDAQGIPLYDVTITIDVECGLSAARTLQAYLDLKRTAHLLCARPTVEEIEADERACVLRALIASDELPSLLEHRLSQMVDVLEAQVLSVGPAVSEVQERDDLASSVPTEDGAPRQEGSALGQEGTAPRQEPPTMPQTLPSPAAALASGDTTRVMPEKGTHLESSIRISVGILDDLMSLVSELVLGRTRLQMLRSQLHVRFPNDDDVAGLEDAVGHLDRVSNDLQATVMKARMLPVENVFNKFPRLMRDLAAQQGKRVSFSMSGQETELDRSVIEQLSDPLIHLLRNAIDHGVETPEQRRAAGKPEIASITLSATPCENHIVIDVRDDGHGIDGHVVTATAIAKGLLTAEAAERLSEREAVELIFSPGLSTARTITDISGRGVGMDIVKSTIERMGGHIQIDSAVGAGTTFSITLPLTLAIMQALLVSVDDAVYALPLNVVTEILSIEPHQIQMLQGTPTTVVRGAILPLIRLRRYFGCAPAPTSRVIQVVATRVDGQLLGLVVDRFIGEQEIVMKPLGTYMGAIPGLAGATILGDGRIGLLVDVASLKSWSSGSDMAMAA